MMSITEFTHDGLSNLPSSVSPSKPFPFIFLCARRVRVPTHEKCSPHITNISITVLRDPLDVSNRGVYTISMHYVAHSCIC